MCSHRSEILPCRAPSAWLIWCTGYTHTRLMIFFSLSPPYPFLSFLSHSNLPTKFFIFTPHLFFTVSHYSPHSSLSTFIPRHPPSCLYMWFVLPHSSLSLLIYLFTLSLPLPLCFSGRLLIAVSQYHGGRQRGCRSCWECSTRTAGSHSHVQPWHLGQVSLVHTLRNGLPQMFTIRVRRGGVCMFGTTDHTLGCGLISLLVLVIVGAWRVYECVCVWVFVCVCSVTQKASLLMLSLHACVFLPFITLTVCEVSAPVLTVEESVWGCLHVSAACACLCVFVHVPEVCVDDRKCGGVLLGFLHASRRNDTRECACRGGGGDIGRRAWAIAEAIGWVCTVTTPPPT